jgi:phosphonate transport system substrate-binding protein
MVIILGAVVGGVLTYTITKGSKQKSATETVPAIATQPAGQPLYFGVTRHKDPLKIKADLKPLIDYLAESIDRPIEIKIIDNYESFANSLASGEVDIVAMSAFNYVSTKEKLTSLQLLATPTNERGSSYGAYILARADSEIKELKDFKGRTFCYPSKTSSSGYVYPRAAFEKVGLDIDRDLRAREVPDHNASLKALLGGGCDGASVYDEVFKNADLTAYTIIRNIKSIPWDAYCASGSLDAATTSALRNALTDLALGSPLAEEVLGETGLNFSGFMPSTDDFYDSVRELL